VIRVDKVPYVDQSGLYAMEEFILSVRQQNVEVVLTDLHGQPAEMFRKIKLVPEMIPEEHCFDSIEQCANWLEAELWNKEPAS